jgi:hypothetical protein
MIGKSVALAAATRVVSADATVAGTLTEEIVSISQQPTTTTAPEHPPETTCLPLNEVASAAGARITDIPVRN